MEVPKSSYTQELSECWAVFAFYEEPSVSVLVHESQPDIDSKKNGILGLVLVCFSKRKNSGFNSKSRFAN
jgi:hypothetical protein